jgi:hypothetical protein
MSEYIFKKPRKYDDWYIFDDAIYSDIELADCNDSISGVCTYTKTFEECLNTCKNKCDFGYFIQTPDNRNFCVPLKKVGEGIDYYHRIKNKSYYPILKNMKTHVFSTTVQPFPSKIPNAVFYTDYFYLKNISSNKNISKSEDDNTISEQVVLSSSDHISLQFLPKEIFRTQVEQYIPVKNGDEIIINIPNSSLILRKQDDNTVSWLFRATTAYVPKNTFIINCKDKNVGEIINFDDEIYLSSDDNVLVYDNNQLSLQPKNQTNPNIMFKMIPKIFVYYCDGSKCNKIELTDTQTSGNIATYKGNPVYRQPNCWGICNNDTSNNSPTYHFPVIMLSIVLFVCLLVIFVYAYK